MQKMEPNKVYTLTTRRPMTMAERRSCIRSVISAVIGLTLFFLGLGMGANAITPDPAPEPAPSRMEIPIATVFAVIDAVEISENDQTAVPVWDVPLTEDELTALLESCEAGCITPETGLGLIQVESDFRADALNPVSGCYGYCQLNPSYFPSGLSPVDNIRTGIGYLAEQLARYDNLEAALTAYNAGYDTGDRTYAEKVIAAAEAFRPNVG